MGALGPHGRDPGSYGVPVPDSDERLPGSGAVEPPSRFAVRSISPGQIRDRSPRSTSSRTPWPHSPSSRPSSEQPSCRPTSFFLDLRTGERTPLAENLAGGLNYEASADGTRLAYRTRHGGGCIEPDEVTVANIDGTDARTLESPEGLTIYLARWSPDGTKLVYQAVPDSVGNLFVQDLSSGRRTQLTDLELSGASWWFLSPIFGPDGANVIFRMPRGSAETTKWDVLSVPVTGGEPTLVLRNAAFPMYFPDGKQIAFVVPKPDSFSGYGIAIARADGQGSRQTLVEADNFVFWPTMSPDGSRIAYEDDNAITVVDVSTGESSQVAEGKPLSGSMTTRSS